MNTRIDTRRHMPLLALTILILVGLACGGTTTTGQPRVSTATPTTPPTPTASAPNVQISTATPVGLSPDVQGATATPTTRSADVQARPISHLGDVVEQDGYFLSALTVEDPATRPGYFYEPEAGKKLVAIEYIVGNISGKAFSSNELSATLVDSQGFLYGAENTAVEDDMELLDVNPGEKVRGWTGFLIPQDAIPAGLKYDFGGSTVIQVGLTPN